MLALLYDVHGNLPALEAVLADAEAAGAERWLLGGDYAAFGGWPEETVARLRKLPGAVWIRGNADRWLHDRSDVPEGPVGTALDACAKALGPDVVAELVALQEQVAIGTTLCCHASPRSDMESFAPEGGDDAGDERLLAGAAHGRVVFGHTHVPFRRIGPGGVELVNPGSIGIPLDRDVRASYALIGEHGVEHRRIGYDHEAAAERVVTRFDGASWTETFARRIRTARF